MVSGFHTRMRNMVIRQLGPQPRGKGSPTTLKRISGRKFNPKTGRNEDGVEETFTGSAVRVNYSEKNFRDVTIQSGDFQLYLSPVIPETGEEHPEPKVDDRIVFLGKSCHIIRVEPFNDNGIGCGWKLQVRYG